MKIIKNFLKIKDYLRFLIAKFLLDFVPEGKSLDFSLNSIRFMTVLKTDGKLGDTEVLSPFLKGIKKYFPDIKITVITTQNLHNIFLKFYKVDSIYILNKRPNFKDIKKTCSFIKRCDLFFSTEKFYRPRDFLFEHFLHPLYSASFEDRVKCVNLPLEWPVNGKTFFDSIALFFKKSGLLLNSGDFEYVHFYDDSIIRKLVLEFPFITHTVIINPRGASRSRMLNPQLLSWLCNQIISLTSFSILILNINSKNELQSLSCFLDEISSLDSRFVFLGRKINSIELAGLIAACSAVISVDTSTVHLAESAGKPLLALYGGDNFNNAKRWMVRKESSKSVLEEGVPIFEISSDMCKKGLDELLTMTNDSVDPVLEIK